MIKQEILDQIVGEQDVVALGLVTPAGLPHNTPIWVSAKNGKLYMFSRSSRAKVKYARQNENCMVAFKWASVRGKVKVLERGTPEFEPIKDVMDARYSQEAGYDEYKRNWDVVLEITPTKLYR